MKIIAIVLLLCLFFHGSLQISEFEKEALASVQRRSASSLDEGLPTRPFGSWFKEIAGEQAGVVWQLSECGDPAEARDRSGDLPACAEANALLPNGRKVIVMILVGTFMKGMKGEPTFFGGVIEQNDKFYRVNRLRDLPKLVRDPGRQPVDLPGVTAKQALLKFHFQESPVTETKPLESDTDGGRQSEAPPPPPEKPRKVEEVVVQGWAVTKIKPEYPAGARSMNASGPVKVRIVISPEGKVLEATAISGHFALRSAAVEAARGWVFKPATLDGVPFNMESVLTFVFASGSK